MRTWKTLPTAVAMLLPLLAAQGLAFSPQSDAAESPSGAETLIDSSDCASCHALDRGLVGPSYIEVADRYAGQVNAVDQIGRSVREGNSGVWGEVAMPPHQDLEDADLYQIVEWVLSRTGAASSGANAITYAHLLPEGETVELDFPLFIEDRAPIVTREVFDGYLLFNSYCFRCHGQDATGSQLAPDLRRSLGNGMTAREYLSVAMVGREDGGMPSWAGFLTAEEVRQTYMYVEGRRLGLVPAGRPPSDY